MKQQLLMQVMEEDGIELMDRGNHYKLLCPFHEDKNPSCVIYKDSEYYLCYACGAKGDVFNYLWHARKMGYSMAVKHYGLTHTDRVVIRRRPSLIEHIVQEEQGGVNVIAKYGTPMINTLLIQELMRLSDGKDKVQE